MMDNAILYVHNYILKRKILPNNKNVEVLASVLYCSSLFYPINKVEYWRGVCVCVEIIHYSDIAHYR